MVPAGELGAVGREVADRGARGTAHAGDSLGDRGGPLRVAAVYDDCHAFGCQCRGDHGAEPGAAAGNQRAFTGDVQIDLVPRFFESQRAADRPG